MKKRALVVLVLAFVGVFGVWAWNTAKPTFSESTQKYSWADSVLQSLTLDQKIGQLFMVAAWSDQSKETYNPKQIESLIKNQGIGGVIFFQGGPVRQAKLTNRFQAISKVPLLIGIDAEWGLGMRLDSTVVFPRQMTLGASGNEKLIYEFGAEVARQCKRIGVHMNYAPVVDVNSNPKNPVISNRSFGENKVRVTSCALAYMKGMQDNGVLASAKHFPGHGDTEADSHKELPVINKTYAQLDETEFFPYKELFKHHVASVMVAHLSLPLYEKEAHVPSTLSKTIITSWLRDSLKYDGLVMTDAMNMEGVAKYFPAGEADVRALIAGNDVVLFPLDVPLAVQKVKQALAEGRITEAQINEKVRRVLRAKEDAGLNHYAPVKIKGIAADLNTPSTMSLKRRLIESSITFISPNQSLPLHQLENPETHVGLVIIGEDENCEFVKAFEKYTSVKVFTLAKECDEVSIHTVEHELKSHCNQVVVAYLGTTNKAATHFGVTPQSIKAAKHFADHLPTTAVLFACPYALDNGDWGQVQNFAIGYQADVLTQHVMADALCGAISVNGKLPVSVGSKFKEGDGMNVNASGKLRYLKPSQTGWFNFNANTSAGGNASGVYTEDMMASTPVEVTGSETQLFSEIDKIAKEGIEQGAYPGCRIFIAKEGVVLYDKSFGYLDQSHSQQVKASTLYDLASVTKMLSSTMALMKLVDEGKLEINKTLGDYLDLPADHPHAKMQLKRMLAHTAGLPAWKDFTTYTTSKGQWNLSLSAVYTDSCCIPVCANMYVNQDVESWIYDQILKVELKPEQGYLYSDLGYYYYKKIIEKLTGEKLDAYVRKTFYSPMELNYIGYNPSKRFSTKEIAPTEKDNLWRKQHVHGYVHDQGAALLGGVGGHAGLFSNAYDCAALMQMLLNGGTYGGKQYLTPETIQLFNTRYFPDNRRGLGFDKPSSKDWSGSTGPSASEESFGHTGFTGTICWADPANGTVYIFLSNRNCPSSENWKINDLKIRMRIQEEIYKVFPVKP